MGAAFVANKSTPQNSTSLALGNTLRKQSLHLKIPAAPVGETSGYNNQETVKTFFCNGNLNILS